MVDISKLLNSSTRGRGQRQAVRDGESRSRNSYEAHDYAEPVSFEGYTVLAIMLMETGTYNPEFLRPYSVSVDRSDLTAMADIAEQQGGLKLNPTSIAGVAGRILRYSSDVSRNDLVDIENGWDNRRLSFLIEVIEDDRPDYEYNSRNTQTVTYISGWTDRMDLVQTRSGDLAPPDDLTFYVSNVHRIEREKRRIQTNHQLIVPAHHDLGAYNPDRRRDLYTIRPRDVFNDEMSREATPSNSRRLNTSNRLHGTMPKTNRSTNLLPSTYIASSVNALIRGETQRGSGHDGYGNYDSRNLGTDSVYSKASSLLNEATPYERNSFVYLMRSKSSEFASRSTFTWGDLVEIFSRDITRVASLYKRKTVERRDEQRGRGRWAQAGDSESWDSNANSGYNAVFATALKQALPGYALESMIYSCRIEATNIISRTESFDAYNGILITVSDVVFIARMPNAQEENILIEQLKENIATNILRDVSLDNSIDFDVVVDLDWRNDSFFSVAIDGGEMIEFSSASFSNALTSPIITTNGDFTENMVQDLKAVVTEILGRTR